GVLACQTVGLEIREAPVAFAIVRPHAYAFAVGRYRLLPPANGFQHMTQPEQRSRKLRPQCERLPVRLYGASSHRSRRKGAGQLEMRMRVVRLEPYDLFEALHRFLELVLLFQDVTKVRDGAGEIRRERYRTPEQPLRIAAAPGAQSDAAEHAQRVDVRGIIANDFSIKLLRFF